MVMLSIGYFTGLAFVAQTESTSVKGISENYNGNDDQESPKVLKFKKSSREMLTVPDKYFELQIKKFLNLHITTKKLFGQHLILL